jgi:hypothetical protein
LKHKQHFVTNQENKVRRRYFTVSAVKGEIHFISATVNWKPLDIKRGELFLIA